MSAGSIFIAADTAELDHARSLAQAIRGKAGGIKLGLEFFCAQGPAGVATIAELGLPLFLDLKLHDIPNTVASAVRSLQPLRPSILTVHAGGGRAMLEAAREAAPEGTKVVGVTMLTSLDQSDLRATGVTGSPAEQVALLAHLARSAGLDGIVCSGAEVAAARAQWADGFFVVPGIRPEGSDTGDQKRVVTPRQALAHGASVLVIGRAVTAAQSPAEALERITASLS